MMQDSTILEQPRYTELLESIGYGWEHAGKEKPAYWSALAEQLSGMSDAVMLVVNDVPASSELGFLARIATERSGQEVQP